MPKRCSQVIADEALHFKVMLGVDMAAEMSNPHCPWGADFSDETLEANRQANSEQIEKAIALSNRYPEIVFCVSVGNEASVEWTDHMVPVDSLVAHVLKMKSAIKQPVTFCENYVPWTYKLEPLAEVLDVISIHTYPAWEYRSVHDALEYTNAELPLGGGSLSGQTGCDYRGRLDNRLQRSRHRTA